MLERQFSHDRWGVLGAGGLILLVMALAGVWLMDNYAREADFLFYRLAQNLHAGHGLVYNAGERGLLVLHPLPVLPLALAPESAPEIAALVTACGYALTGGLMFRWLCRAGMTLRQAGFTLALWLTAWPIWAGMRSPAVLTLLVILLALEAADHNRWRLAGLVAGLAVLIQPEGILASLALGIYLIASDRPWRYWQTVWIPGGAWLAVSLLFLVDGGLSDLVIASVPPAGPGAWLGAIWVVLLIPAVFVLARKQADTRLWFLALWAALEVGARLIIYGRLGQVECAPLALVAACALVIGSRSLVQSQRTVVLGVALAGSLALLVLSPPQTAPSLVEDMELAEALDIPANAVIAHDRSDAFTYAMSNAESTVYCLDGRYSPEITAMLERGDWQSLVVAFAPGYFYYNTLDESFSNLSVSGQQMTALAYVSQPVLPDVPGVRQGDVLLRRESLPGTFGDSLPVDLAFGADLRLTSYAVDRVRIQPGQVVRVRLDWELDQAPKKDMDVYITMLSGSGSPVTSVYSRFPPENWEPLSLSTYQVLAVPEDAESGPLNVFITVGYDAGTLGQHRLAALLIPPDQALENMPLAPDGDLGTLGDAVLKGARVIVGQKGLRVRLIWDVRRTLGRDYTVFVHLTPVNDVSPQAQGDGPPAGGLYPSSFWVPDAPVLDEHIVLLEGVPPGDYLVRVGLYTPEDGRLSGEQGDHIVVAQVRVSADGSAEVFPPPID